jgi:hypothetical protein
MQVQEFILTRNGSKIKNKPEIILIGVGNSGTKLLGELIHALLKKQGFPLYYYEPLYWSGTNGENNIKLNLQAINEHNNFPLFPTSNIDWPWLDKFIENLVGVAKFISLGSRIEKLKSHPVSIIWITRELYSYLASMQKNFPRCLPDAGWHHRQGKYDDFKRLKKIYKNFDLRSQDQFRVEVEAAWWHLHNSQMLRHLDLKTMLHIRYEDLCLEPAKWINKISKFINIPFSGSELFPDIQPPPERDITLSPRNIRMIESIAGDLNRKLYPQIKL